MDKMRPSRKAETQHTCNPEDRREGQIDADCTRCQEIFANRIKREAK